MPKLFTYFSIFILFAILRLLYLFFFFLNDPAPTEIYPLPLPDALPISPAGAQPQGPAFKSSPQRGHSPRQSSRHTTHGGTASNSSSRTAGRRSICVASRARG